MTWWSYRYSKCQRPAKSTAAGVFIKNKINTIGAVTRTRQALAPKYLLEAMTALIHDGLPYLVADAGSVNRLNVCAQ